MHTLANNEDSDEKTHIAVFHQDLLAVCLDKN